MSLKGKAQVAASAGVKAARRKLPETLVCLAITLPFAVLSAWLSRIWKDAAHAEGRWIFLAAQLPVGALIFRFILRNAGGLQVKAALKDGLLHAAIYGPLLCLCVGLRIAMERTPPWLRLGASSDGVVYLYIAAFAWFAHCIQRREKENAAKPISRRDVSAAEGGTLEASAEGAREAAPDPNQLWLFDPERHRIGADPRSSPTRPAALT